jgi:hypothetical protein
MTVKNNPVRMAVLAGSCILKSGGEIKVEFKSKTRDAKIQQEDRPS